MFDGPLTTELDPAERRARLRLARSPRIGPVTFHEALQHFGSARRACREPARSASEAAIAREEAGARANSAGASWCSATPITPPPLAALPDAPPVLSAIGDLGRWLGPTLAIVGAREASLAGRRFAAELAGVARPGRLRHRLRPGARHRCRGPRGRPADRHGRRPGRRHRPGLSAAERRLQQRHRRARPAAGRDAVRHAADRPLLPAPQPHRQRPVGRGDRDRGGGALGLPDHRPTRRSNRAARCSSCRARRWTRAMPDPIALSGMGPFWCVMQTIL